jgi:hypothetical protein
MEESMNQSNAVRSDEGGDFQETPRSGNLPKATFKQGGVEVTVWQNGDNLYNATVRNSYKDEKTGEWKETTSYGPADLAVTAQLTSQAFQEIVKLKARGRGR